MKRRTISTLVMILATACLLSLTLTSIGANDKAKSGSE